MTLRREKDQPLFNLITFKGVDGTNEPCESKGE